MTFRIISFDYTKKAIELKCFAENWTCTTIPQEIDHNSKSIYPTHN